MRDFDVKDVAEGLRRIAVHVAGQGDGLANGGPMSVYGWSAGGALVFEMSFTSDVTSSNSTVVRSPQDN